MDLPTPRSVFPRSLPGPQRWLWLTEKKNIHSTIYLSQNRWVRDEETWDGTHLYLETMLGNSLYSYPYLN
jgi:hypothetical protein